MVIPLSRVDEVWYRGRYRTLLILGRPPKAVELKKPMDAVLRELQRGQIQETSIWSVRSLRELLQLWKS